MAAKRSFFSFILLLFLSAVLQASSFQFQYDQYFSSTAGASLLSSTQRELLSLQQHFIKAPVQKTLSKALYAQTELDFAGRLLNFIYFDYPLSHYLMLWQHEFFGHGYRMRELGFRDLRYYVSSVWPYVDTSSGYASGITPSGISRFEFASVYAAGIEANRVLANQILESQFQSGTLQYSEGLLAFFSFRDFASYVNATEVADIASASGDIAGYLKEVNAAFGYSNVNDYALTLEDLQNAAELSALSPLHLIYASAFVRYLYDGDTAFAFPYLYFKDYQYFFNVEPSLSPFGLAWEFSLWLNKWPTNKQSRFRFVKSDGQLSDFWLFSYSRSHLYQVGGLQLGLELAFWQQPQLDALNPQELKPGALVLLKSTFRIKRLSEHSQGRLDIGYKDEGYVRGFELGQGLLTRFAIDWQF